MSTIIAELRTELKTRDFGELKIEDCSKKIRASC